VLEAAFWGLVGASTLLLGAALAIVSPWPRRAIGLVAGFGAGALISAVTLDLTASAFDAAGIPAVTVGLALGAAAFSVGNVLIHRGGPARHRKRSHTGLRAPHDPSRPPGPGNPPAWPVRRVLMLWTIVVGLSGIAAGLGYVLLAGSPPMAAATIQAFAAGAVLAMLADTMMPEAFEEAGQAVGAVTVLGFAVGTLLTLA